MLNVLIVLLLYIKINFVIFLDVEILSYYCYGYFNDVIMC